MLPVVIGCQVSMGWSWSALTAHYNKGTALSRMRSRRRLCPWQRRDIVVLTQHFPSSFPRSSRQVHERQRPWPHWNVYSGTVPSDSIYGATAHLPCNDRIRHTQIRFNGKKGVNSEVFNKGNVRQLVESILELAKNSGKRRNYSLGSKLIRENEYSIEKRVRITEEVYRDVYRRN